MVLSNAFHLAQVGLATTVFGAGIAWGDYDTDGYLDLYIGNYIEYTKVPQGDEVFFPYDFFGQTNILYLNKGDGGFINITDAAKVKRRVSSDAWCRCGGLRYGWRSGPLSRE